MRTASARGDVSRTGEFLALARLFELSMTRHPPLLSVVWVALISCSISSSAPAQPAPRPREVVDDGGLVLFRERQVDGAFVLVDLDAGTTFVVGSGNADQRVTPASTYKIPNALIALETGVAGGPAFPLRWDGVARTMPDWNRDHTLASAIRFSVVWYFQEIARRIGAARMQRWVDAFEYGNRDLSGGIDRFWLESSLRISPREQAAFAAKLANGTLPLRPATIAAVRDMIVLEREGGGVLSGKTGSAEQDGRTIGWLVGTFTRTRRYAYATLLLAPAGQIERVRPLRLEITKALLRRRGV